MGGILVQSHNRCSEKFGISEVTISNASERAPRLTHSRKQSRFIYCATDGDVVKVGSTLYPERRVKALARDTGRALRLVRVWHVPGITGARILALESHVHSVLHGDWRRWRVSEWYHAPVDELIPVISTAIASVRKLWRSYTMSQRPRLRRSA